MPTLTHTPRSRPPAGTPAPRGRRQRLAQLALPPKRLAPALVSAPAPGSFVHVAHVGFDARGEVEASHTVGPGWRMMLGELPGFGAKPPAAPTAAARADAKPSGERAWVSCSARGDAYGQSSGTQNKRGPVRRKPVVAFA